MDADFPAAHSMDTTWFAVDRDGHVGCFDSSEPGAVPVAAMQVAREIAVLEEIRQLVPAREAIHDLAGWLVPGPTGKTDHHWMFDHPDRGDQFLVFIDSAKDAQTLLTDQTTKSCLASDGTALVLMQPSLALIQALHVLSICRGCCYHPGSWDTRETTSAARLGLFAYDHLEYVDLNHEYVLPAPYGRQMVPQQALHVDQLSPAVRKMLLKVRFSALCFTETPHIQPVEFTACESWGDAAFLSGDGKRIVPLLPESANYRTVYDSIVQHGLPEGMTIQPPVVQG
jgi:hypothetical protein